MRILVDSRVMQDRYSLFGQRGLDLSQLLIPWELMNPGVVAAARWDVEREAWQRGFEEMVANV